MKVALLRHGEAEEGAEDFTRRLTARGERQAEAAGRLLRLYQLGQPRLITSTAKRAFCTAGIIRELLAGAAVYLHSPFYKDGTISRDEAKAVWDIIFRFETIRDVVVVTHDNWVIALTLYAAEMASLSMEVVRPEYGEGYLTDTTANTISRLTL